jgi:hypothetical protein
LVPVSRAFRERGVYGDRVIFNIVLSPSAKIDIVGCRADITSDTDTTPDPVTLVVGWRSVRGDPEVPVIPVIRKIEVNVCRIGIIVSDRIQRPGRHGCPGSGLAHGDRSENVNDSHDALSVQLTVTPYVPTSAT